MKEFSKILGEALMERKETLKQQKELAEEIIESALKQFSNVGVSAIFIIYNGQNEIIVGHPEASECKKVFSNLCHGKVVYSIIEKILDSCEDEIVYLESQISIALNSDDPKSIIFKLEEDELEELLE